MIRTKCAVACVAVGAAALARPTDAHHSFAAEYDANQPISLHGTVARIDLVNPHAWLYLEVKETDGSTTRWNVEMGAPNNLIRRGINKNTVPVGAEVTVDGYRAKDGSNTVNSSTIKLADGRSLFSGSTDTGAPAPR
jgi:Family of unknown function (DUF6152)